MKPSTNTQAPKAETENKGVALKSILKALQRRWNELPLMILAGIVFIAFPSVIHLIDPTAGAFDLGLIQRLCYAAFGTFACHFTVWLMIQFSFPNLMGYFYNVFEHDLLQHSDSLSGDIKYKNRCLRLTFSLSVLALYLLVFLWVLSTIQ